MAADSEDVNDFLKRIQELGTKRDQEDEERNRKLEEEILQGRKERQARRAERARSISPSKDFPNATPTHYQAKVAGSPLLASRPNLPPAPELHPTTRDKMDEDTMDRLTGALSPAQEKTSPRAAYRDDIDTGLDRSSSIKASPSSAMPPARSSALSWQQRRPNSQASDRPRSRPLSIIATENAARSPKATPESSPKNSEHPSASRDQISQMLSSKDPSWFRQTADRGENSPAYRKNQIEDNNVADVITSSRVQLPGMSRESIRQEAGSIHGGGADIERSTSHSRNSFSDDNPGRSSYTGAMTTSARLGSPIPLTSAQKFSPPAPDIVSTNEASGCASALSPAEGRISPERMDRPSSPTKGMGGFVQSAMMKRSDSVNKRWSVQSPPGLSRGNSVAGDRTSLEAISALNMGGKLAREPRPSTLSRDNSPLPLSRPGSSYGNATTLQENEPSRKSNSATSSLTTSTTNEAFAKPVFPASQSQVLPDSREQSEDHSGDLSIETSAPTSPSKMGNSGRWSPTKSSWLESALNKPESPKPKAAPPSSQQPSWMAEINKAKQRNANGLKNQQAPKHEVKIGGLIRSPPPGALAKPFSIGRLPAGFSSGSVAKNMDASTGSSDGGSATTSEAPHLIDVGKSKPSIPLKSPSNSPDIIKTKPETPPKRDFRANLKSRSTPSENRAQEPEFKNALGQLRRTKTQNYVAPDELKNNILRGKSELTVTGGPKKTERKDEFKEAILKKKEDFKRAQTEGTSVKRPESGTSQAGAAVPEALLKKAAIGKSTILARGQHAVSEISNEFQKPGFPIESSIPGRLQSKEVAGSKLADRFNPALATMLARGPPSAASETSRSSTPVSSQRNTSTSTTLSTTTSTASEPSPQLTHMTRARARGPPRKAPSAIAATSEKLTKSAPDPEPGKVKSIPDPNDVSAIRISRVFEEVPPPAHDTQPKTSIQHSYDEPENEKPQPASPKKLDMKRRSRFLEEAPNKNEKTSQGLESPTKPLSPKKANLFENTVTSQEEESNTVDSKSILSERVPSSPTETSRKPLPLSKSIPLPSGKLSQASQLPHHQTILPSKSVASSSEVTTPRSTPLSPSKLKLPALSTQTQDKVDSESVVSVKNATVLFGAQSQQSTAAFKVPIHLPTKDDESSAMINAGLRSANVASGMNQNSRFGDTPRFLEEATKGSRMDVTTRDIGKPLPNPPSKSSIPLLPSAEFGPTSPRKLQSQSSDASRMLIDFFGKHEFVSSFNADTSTILLSKPVEHAKIKTLSSQLFQLSNDGKKQPVPSHQERVLFEGNMYLCIHTFKTQTSKKVVEVYFWSGDAVPDSVVEDADLFARREARSAGGQLVKLCQGKETTEFIEALGGIMITRKGTRNKYDSLAPHILCGRRFAGQIVFDEVDFAPSSLCSGFPYLVASQSGKCYLWKGKGSSVDELSCARLIGMDFGLMGDMEEVEDGNEPQTFLQVFGRDAKIMKSADHWRLKPSYQKYSGRLFCADSSAEAQITEINPFSQADISASNIYVLDAFFEIYIVVGARSQSQFESFCSALLFAQEYGILAAGMEDRPFVPVSTVVLEGVPRDLKFVLRKWTDSLAPTVIHSPTTTLTRGRSLRVVPLNAALDAARF